MHRFIRLSLVLAALIGLMGNAYAKDDYPSKPITLVVPFPPGGAVDIVGRALAQELTLQTGDQVIVENKPGANGVVGTEYVSHAAPDGYTVLLSALGAITIIPHVQKVGYDPMTDLVPVTQAVSLALVWVARQGLPAHSVQELIALDKSGQKLTVGSSGNGSPNHLAIEELNQMAGTHFLHVPYRGEGPALADLMGGHIDLVVTTLVAAAGPLASGHITALAAAGAKPPQSMPSLPTIAASGVAGYEAQAWQGVFVPAGTPQPIVDKLNQLMVKVLHSAKVKDYLAKNGTESVGNSAAEFSEFVHNESDRYGKLAKAINLKLD
ncbi:MAG TPA: tripartite tricarboxylate transporter substrate binding protein [Bordetella sp.]